MKEQKGLLGIYDYTVILTYIGMLCGFAGILFAINDRYLGALVLLMVAGICDMFDGAIASTKKDRTKDGKSFGIQIDSLSDLVCFGVLPAVIVSRMSDGLSPWLIIPALFVLCGLIRLAFYNVDEANRQELEAEPRAHYLGLPITSSALGIPLMFVAADLFSLPAFPLCLGMLVFIGVFYIVPVKIVKVHAIGKSVLVAMGLAEFIYLIVQCCK